MVSFFLNSFPLKTCRDDFKIEIAEQFVQIKWKVLHSPKFVSFMIFFSSNLSAKKLKSIILLPFSILFLLVGWYFKNRHFICLGFFLLKRPTWSRPSEAIFVPTEASKTFNQVNNRTSVYTYLPYTVFCGFILLRLCRIRLQVTFQFFLISSIIQKSCKM